MGPYFTSLCSGDASSLCFLRYYLPALLLLCLGGLFSFSVLFISTHYSKFFRRTTRVLPSGHPPKGFNRNSATLHFDSPKEVLVRKIGRYNDQEIKELRYKLYKLLG